MTKTPSGECDRETRRREIIESALHLFSEKGYHEVKMEEVAERVGLAKGTVYLYFRNKEELFFSVIGERMEAFIERIEKAVSPAGTFIEKVRLYVTTFLGFLEDHRPFFKIMHSEKLRIEDPTRIHEMMGGAYEKIFTITEGLILIGQKEGLLRPDPPRVLSKVLLGILDAYLFQRVLIGTGKRLEEEVEEILDYFLNGVRAITAPFPIGLS